MRLPASRSVLPTSWRVIGYARPPRGSSTSRYSDTGLPVVYPAGCLPQALAPLQSLAQDTPTHGVWLLSRGSCPPQRNPVPESHHSRTCLIRVMLRPRTLFGCPDALLPRGPLWCLSTRHAHGVCPLQSLTWRRSPTPLGATSPLAIDCRFVGRFRSNALRYQPRGRCASLQRFHPFAGWDVRRRISPRHGILALLGFALPGAFPSPSLGLVRRRPLSGAP